MLDMEDFLFIRELYNQGVTISQIARETGFDRKTIRKYVLSGEPPTARPRVRRPGKLDDYKEYIRNRISGYPPTTARIYREIQEQGFTGKYTIVRDYIRRIQPEVGVSADPWHEAGPGARRDRGHPDAEQWRRGLACFSIVLEYSRIRYKGCAISPGIPTLIRNRLSASGYPGGRTG
ncbi:MAG: transposase [Methanomicrobiales archaeon]|nr:transposase [Methanomicrobiales archaeon]